jgi:hypothetical protein
MSDINITIEGGTSKRLLVAGTMPRKNIVVTATCGGLSEIGSAKITFTETVVVDGYGILDISSAGQAGANKIIAIATDHSLAAMWNPSYGYCNYIDSQNLLGITPCSLEDSAWAIDPNLNIVGREFLLIFLKEVTLIDFSIAQDDYQAEYGMTWKQWAESDYANGDWSYSGDSYNRIISRDGVYYICKNDTAHTPVSGSELIAADTQYQYWDT